MKVAILTNFYEVDSGYSLIAVVETQIKMLLNHGYDPMVIVHKDFKSGKPLWQPSQIDLRPSSLDEIKSHLDEAEVCITHDAILLYPDYEKIVRSYQGNIKWLHYIHSCPNPNKADPPPGYIIYPNASDKARVVQAYRMQGQEHRVIPSRSSHSIDPLSIWNYDPLTRSIIEKFNLLGADISAVYPVRLDRGKQPEKIIRLLSGVQRAGYTTRLLIIDWQSAGNKFQRYINELSELAAGLNVDLAFTSRLDDRCNQGVPRHIVTELMDLSNIYIHPSKIETYSLVVHEAILRGKLVCLNHDLPAMKELYGESAIYFDFGSDRVERKYHPNEQAFWNDEAHRLIGEFYKNRALVAQSKARQEWTPSARWRDFERLLYLD